MIERGDLPKDYLHLKCRELRTKVVLMTRFLDDLEWGSAGEGITPGFCPVCGVEKFEDCPDHKPVHRDWCRLAEILKVARNA
jgi:hypothetical protein